MTLRRRNRIIAMISAMMVIVWMFALSGLFWLLDLFASAKGIEMVVMAQPVMGFLALVAFFAATMAVARPLLCRLIGPADVGPGASTS